MEDHGPWSMVMLKLPSRRLPPITDNEKTTATILETCQVKQLKFLGDGVSFLKGNAKKNPMGIN